MFPAVDRHHKPTPLPAALDFVITVDIRDEDVSLSRDEIGWWHIGPGINAAMYLAKLRTIRKRFPGCAPASVAPNQRPDAW